MASIKYRIKGTKNPVSIFARLYINGISVEIKTGFQVNKLEWSESKSRVKLTANSNGQYDLVNNSLRDLEQFFHKEINLAHTNSSPINKDWLKDIPRRCFNQIPKGDENDINFFFVSFVESFIEESKTRINGRKGKPLSVKTIADYKGTVKKLKHFENEIWKGKLKHSDISIKFHNAFIKFCTDYFKIRPKTIGGEIDNIKLFCRRAENKGIKVCHDFKSNDFFSPDNKTKDFALTIEEIKAIETVDLTHSGKLDNARDWFVIGIWTGLRVSDLLNLSKSNIEEEFICVTAKKTNIPVVIPIHKSVKDIFQKRKNLFPRNISTQKFNDYIKEVSKLAGLTELVEGGKMMPIKIKGYSNEEIVHRKQDGKYPKYKLISSHCCRRTFATFHYGKLDTLTIMNITGHKTERQFLEYVKITPKKHAEAMKAMWTKFFKDVGR